MKNVLYNIALLSSLLAAPYLSDGQALPDQIYAFANASDSDPCVVAAVRAPSATQLMREEAAASTQRSEIEKVKKVNRTFSVGPNEKLDIDNKFGKVHINTWDKNEIAVEVAMVARGNSEERVQSLLDRMDVNINQSGGVISFQTKIGSMNTKGRNNESFQINYTVSMPKNNPLRLKNGFGDAYLANYNGKADLDISYGSLKTDRLSGSENTVKVSFGSGNLGYVKNGRLNISYSDVTVTDSDVLDLKNEFSDIKIERVNDLKIVSKYGEVKLGKARSLQGSTEFSGFRIKELDDKLDMRVQYCGDFRVNKIGRDFKLINLDGGFSTFDLNFENGATYNFDVALSFGKLRFDKEGADFSRIEQKNTSSHHTGKVGKTGNANVTIKAQYGDVKIDRAD